MGRKQEAVLPPPEPVQFQRYSVLESAISESAPVAQELSAVEQEPLIGVGGGGGVPPLV